MAQLADLATLKARLGITDCSSDQMLRLALDSSERTLITYLGFDPTSSTKTLFFDTSGTEFLPLGRYVTAITNVWEDANGYYGDMPDSFDATDTLLVQGEDYVLRQDGGEPAHSTLLRIGRFWPVSRSRPLERLGRELSPCRGCVKVTFISGLSAAQYADLAEVVLLEAATRFRMRQFGDGSLQSESLDGRSIGLGISQRNSGGTYSGPFASLLARDIARPHRLTPIAGL